MGNDQPALRALLACESVLSEPEIGLEHAFVLGRNGKIRTVPGLQKQPKTALILSVTFI
jgi:hypothetical protein